MQWRHRSSTFPGTHRLIQPLAIAVSRRLTSFRPALPGYEFAFPRDHGTHDEYLYDVGSHDTPVYVESPGTT